MVEWKVKLTPPLPPPFLVEMRDARLCLIMQKSVGLRRHTGHGWDGRASLSSQIRENQNVGERVSSERSLSPESEWRERRRQQRLCHKYLHH